MRAVSSTRSWVSRPGTSLSGTWIVTGTTASISLQIIITGRGGVRPGGTESAARNSVWPGWAKPARVSTNLAIGLVTTAPARPALTKPTAAVIDSMVAPALTESGIAGLGRHGRRRSAAAPRAARGGTPRRRSRDRPRRPGRPAEPVGEPLDEGRVAPRGRTAAADRAAAPEPGAEGQFRADPGGIPEGEGEGWHRRSIAPAAAPVTALRRCRPRWWRCRRSGADPPRPASSARRAAARSGCARARRWRWRSAS